MKITEPPEKSESDAPRSGRPSRSGAKQRLQRLVGNHAVQHLLRPQDDPMEAEAHRVAASAKGGVPVSLRRAANARLHTDGAAGDAAASQHAAAYTVGRDVYFGHGLYDPHSPEGAALIAHELTHVVQQSGGDAAAGIHAAPVGVARRPVYPRPEDFVTFEEFAQAWPDRVTSTDALWEMWNRQTRRGWTIRALQAAGIDPRAWIPRYGFRQNMDNINKVYEYYASLYLANPRLRWAAMAKLAGGEVYRGLEDELQPQIDFAAALDDNDPRTIGLNDLYEAYAGSMILILLEMQQDIFFDMAWQHEAYRTEGISAIRMAFERDEISFETYKAWLDIDSGDEERIWEGNKNLLRREQGLILEGGEEYFGRAFAGGQTRKFQAHYARIRNIPDYGMIPDDMSAEALSPVPGGTRFSKSVRGGDITLFKDRWKWIETDMFPKFKAMAVADLRRLLAMPVSTLAKRKF